MGSMRLRPADIDRIMDSNSAKPQSAKSAMDFSEADNLAKKEFLRSITNHKTAYSAAEGQILPLAPPSMEIDALFADQNLLTPQDTDHETLLEELSPTATTAYEEAVGAGPPEMPSLPLALRGANLDHINCRADLIALLTSNLPQNEFGLPKFIYRGDLIDWRLFQGHPKQPQTPEDLELIAARFAEMQQYLDAALVHLSYTEGFPALPTGEPLWARLPFEDTQHFAAFSDFCLSSGARQTAELAARIHVAHSNILQWYHEDYWAIRVLCYDMMQAIHAAKIREKRLLACEDNQYAKSEILLGKLSNIIDQVNWDALKEEPDKFVATFERVAKLQRSILGALSPNGKDANTTRTATTTDTVEVAMRKIAPPRELKYREDDTVSIKSLLRDPNALSSAQELIIRMTRSEQIHERTIKAEEVEAETPSE